MILIPDKFKEIPASVVLQAQKYEIGIRPVYDVKSDRLIRIDTAIDSLLGNGPGEWVDVFSKGGRINETDITAAKHVLETLGEFERSLEPSFNAPILVTISAHLACDNRVLKWLSDQVRFGRWNAKRFIFEIPESTLLDSAIRPAFGSAVPYLKGMGVKLAISDFGASIEKSHLLLLAFSFDILLLSVPLVRSLQPDCIGNKEKFLIQIAQKVERLKISMECVGADNFEQLEWIETLGGISTLRCEIGKEISPWSDKPHKFMIFETRPVAPAQIAEVVL